MKKNTFIGIFIIAAFMFAFTSPKISLNDKSNFFPLIQGNSLEMFYYDANNSYYAKTVAAMQNVQKISGSDIQGTLDTKDYDSKNNLIDDTKYTVKLGSNSMSVDMRLFIQPLPSLPSDVKTKDEIGYVDIPYNLKIGASLDDASTTTNLYRHDSLVASVIWKFVNRKVEAREKVTVPAGTFDCFKITFQSQTKQKNKKGEQDVNTENNTWWFSPGTGLVKTATYDNNKNLLYTSVLNKIKTKYPCSN